MCNKIDFLRTVSALVITEILFIFLIINSSYWKKLTDKERVDLRFDICKDFGVTILFILVFRYFLYCSMFFNKIHIIVALLTGIAGIILSLVAFWKKDYDFSENFSLLQYVLLALFSAYWLFSKYKLFY